MLLEGPPAASAVPPPPRRAAEPCLSASQPDRAGQSTQLWYRPLPNQLRNTCCRPALPCPALPLLRCLRKPHTDIKRPRLVGFLTYPDGTFCTFVFGNLTETLEG